MAILKSSYKSSIQQTCTIHNHPFVIWILRQIGLHILTKQTGYGALLWNIRKLYVKYIFMAHNLPEASGFTLYTIKSPFRINIGV